MAQKVQVLLVDDLDGGTAEESVVFGLDGVSYEIDLSSANAAKLRDALAPWVNNARKASPRGLRKGAVRAGRSSKADLAAVRAWARENGHTVSDRGRVSADIMAAFEAAN